MTQTRPTSHRPSPREEEERITHGSLILPTYLVEFPDHARVDVDGIVAVFKLNLYAQLRVADHNLGPGVVVGQQEQLVQADRAVPGEAGAGVGEVLLVQGLLEEGQLGREDGLLAGGVREGGDRAGEILDGLKTHTVITDDVSTCNR